MWNRLGRKRELNCQQVESWLMAYLKKGLSSTNHQKVEDHLAICAACTRSLLEARSLDTELRVQAARHQPILAPEASARIQERIYKRMRRGLIVQRTVKFAWSVAALVAAAMLAMGAVALWQWLRPAEEDLGKGEETILGAVGTEIAYVPPSRLTLGDDRINVLLLGIDRRGGTGWGYRTDTIIVVTVDLTNKSAGILSIPRDLQVMIPDIGEDRINTVNVYGYLQHYPGEGPALLKQTIEANFGILIDYYVMVDFDGFEKIVDTLGGLDVDVPKTLHDTQYPDPRPDDPHAYKSIHFDPGWQQMNGERALEYVRSRVSTSDADRARRQQQILLAIREKALNTNLIPELPDLATTMVGTVETDMTVEEMIELARLMPHIDMANLKQVIIEEPLVYGRRREDGADVQLPRWDQINPLIAELFGVPAGLANIEARATDAPPPSPSFENDRQRVLPSPHMAPTLVRAPVAWLRSSGAGVIVAVTQNHDEDLALVNLIAPDATVEPLEVNKSMRVGNNPLSELFQERGIQILVILSPEDYPSRILRAAVSELIRSGIVVFVNGDLENTERDVDLINELETVGAITVGRLDPTGRPPGQSLSKRQISLFAPYGSRFNHGAVLTTAGVGALVLAAEPGLSPEALKQRLVSTADEMYLGSDLSTGRWDIGNVHVDSKTGNYTPSDRAFRFRRVNAAQAVGVGLEQRWPINALNAPLAWETATGKGIKVAVLDQGFHVDNPVFKGHLVDRATFFPGQDFGGYQNFHGTAMSKIVLAVAPDASLVFLHHGEHYEQMDLVIQAYADAIDYAVENGVDVITSSAGPWPNTPQVHAAIDRAIEAGIVFVWFHYNGPNDAVIRPGFFWDPRWEVGAFDRFFDSDKPSDLEGGLSNTAPQIAGIAALILENEPDLSPLAVKQRILQTATVLPGGNSLADAAAAVANRSTGRQVGIQSMGSFPDGHCLVVYQQANNIEKTTIRIEEQGQHWPFPIWPRRDILLYSASGDDLRFEAFQDNALWLAVKLKTGQSGNVESSAQVNLFLEGWMARSYSATLGAAAPSLLQVEVNGDQVRISWENVEGVPLERANYRGEASSQPDYYLFSLECEAQHLPDLFMTIY